MITKDDIPALNGRFNDASPEEVLAFCLNAYKDRIALSSSLSIEDQALTKMIVDIDKSTRIFTLDTGRLFPETYQLIDRTNLTYNIKIEVFFPDYREVQRMEREEGINLFYNSIESRHRCCTIRKLEPLKRAFQGLDAWICGLRHEQSVTRKNMQLIEWDDRHNMVKVNPLINWTERQRTYPGRTRQRARHRQIQPDFRLERTGSVGLHPAAAPALQRTLPPRLPQHRL